MVMATTTVPHPREPPQPDPDPDVCEPVSSPRCPLDAADSSGHLSSVTSPPMQFPGAASPPAGPPPAAEAVIAAVQDGIAVGSGGSHEVLLLTSLPGFVETHTSRAADSC